MRWQSGLVLSITFGLGLAAGCARPVFHASSSVRFPPRPANCHIRNVGSHPGAGYTEIGYINVEGDNRMFGAGSYRNPAKFVEQVRSEVCRAGGELVITQMNGLGVVVRGIVLRRTGGSARPQPVSGCEPICSPGFRCIRRVCVPQCNPACEAGEKCGRDRRCHKVGGTPP